MAKAQPNRTKAETLSLRVAPDLKFGLELLSKIEDRSLTTIIERALRETFLMKEINFSEFCKRLDPKQYPEVHFGDLLLYLYSIDGPTRLFRTAIVFPAALSVKDLALLDLITGDSYFEGSDKIDFPIGNSRYDRLLKDLTTIFWESTQGVDLNKVRRNWTKLNDVIDAALASGHYPDSYSWD